MKRHLPFYVVAVAILLVGAVAFGVPASSLWILGFVVACPLMMIVMMRGMHGGSAGGGRGDGHGDGGRSGADLTEAHDPHS